MLDKVKLKKKSEYAILNTELTNIKWNKSGNYILFIIVDSLCMVLSILCSFWLKFDEIYPIEYISYYPFYILSGILFLPVLIAIFRCYSVSVRAFGITDVAKLGLVMALGYSLFIIFNLISSYRIPLSIIFMILIINTLFMGMSRVFLRGIAWFGNLYFVRNKETTKIKNTLIYGAGNSGIMLSNMLTYNYRKGFRPVGFIDDNECLWNKKLKGLKVFGGRIAIKEICTKYDIEEIIIAIPHVSNTAIRDIYDYCIKAKCHISRFSNMSSITKEGLDRGSIVNVKLEDLLGRSEVELDTNTLSELIHNKIILITGGAGSIGSEICRKSLEYGANKIIIFDFNENGLFEIDAELIQTYGSDKFVTVLGSIRDENRLEEIFTQYKPNIVFHAAAHKHVPMMEINPMEAIKNNVLGTYNTAFAAQKYNVEKFILISTDKAVNPTNVMGASKRIAELVIQYMNSISKKTCFTAVRFGNVLGSNGSVIPTFKKQIEMGGPVTVTHKDIKRYFMTIPEAVKLVFQAGALAKGSEIFVLNMGEPVYIYDLAHTMIQLAGYTPEKDIKIEFTGLRLGEKLFEEINLENEHISKTENDQIFVLNSNNNKEKFTIEIKDNIQQILQSKEVDKLYIEIKELVPTFK